MTPEKCLLAIEKYRLTLFPRWHGSGAWMARTQGGAHDPAPLLGFGDTPAQAVEDAIRVLPEPTILVAPGTEVEWQGRRVTVASGDEWVDGDGRRFRVLPEQPPVELIDDAKFDDDAFVDPLS